MFAMHPPRLDATEDQLARYHFQQHRRAYGTVWSFEEAWGHSTRERYAGKRIMFEEWGESLALSVPPFDVMLLESWIIDRVDDGDGVLPGTVKKDLTVVNHWHDHVNLILDTDTPSPARHPAITALMKKCERLYGGSECMQKAGATDLAVIRFLQNAGSGFHADHARIVVLTLWCGLLRSVAGAGLRWRGDSDLGIPATDSDISFRDGHTLLKVQVDEAHRDPAQGGDKTQHGKQKTDRVIPDDVGIIGLVYQQTVRDYIRKYKLPDGAHLFATKKADGTWSTSRFTSWTALMNFFCKVCGLPREDYGTHSFRRGFATYLHESGLSLAELQFLGFWWSGTVSMYSGNGVPHALHLLRKMSLNRRLAHSAKRARTM